MPFHRISDGAVPVHVTLTSDLDERVVAATRLSVARAAMQGLLASGGYHNEQQTVATESVAHADALLAELAKPITPAPINSPAILAALESTAMQLGKLLRQLKDLPEDSRNESTAVWADALTVITNAKTP